jgi:hypothetical protein
VLVTRSEAAAFVLFCCACPRLLPQTHNMLPLPPLPQDDPVPRALLSADPAFLALQQNTAVAGLLRLRERWLGQGVLSPTRFLFHPAGDVFLIRCACVCVCVGVFSRKLVCLLRGNCVMLCVHG